jgi:hypothetical protein
MWRDASRSVSTASARICKGDISELPGSPFVRLYSTRWSSGLVTEYATGPSLVSGVCSLRSSPIRVSEIEPEGCKFRDEARIAAITCSPTGDSWMRCKSFSTVSGLLAYMSQSHISDGFDLLDTSLFPASIGDWRILASSLLRDAPSAADLSEVVTILNISSVPWTLPIAFLS